MRTRARSLRKATLVVICGAVLFAGAASALPAASSSTPAAIRPAQPAADPQGHGNPSNSVVATKQQVEYLTQEWKGERYPDGRPKVSDDLLARLKIVSIEAAWGALRGKGYQNQYVGNDIDDGGWRIIHEDKPIIGRALTAQFMPSSPGIEKRWTDAGHAAGLDGQMNTWPIQMLRKGDVYVADGFGKVKDGTLIGGNLGTDIYSKTGTGVVFDGSLRDLEELEQIDGFNAFVRDWHPSYIQQMMLTGINKNIRVGGAVVLPGDVVLAKREGVVFIPAHLVADIVKDAEESLLWDTFVKMRLTEGKYTSGQVDKGWDQIDQAIKDDYRNWLIQNKDKLPVPAARVQEIIDSLGG